MIQLEPLSQAHLVHVQRHAAHPSIGRLSMVPTPYPANGAMAWYAAVSPGIASGRAAIFAVTQEDAFRGIVSINQINTSSHTAELDYWIAHDWHAQGLGTRAVALVVAHACDRLGVRTLDSVCLADNVASLRVLEKNGFSRVESALIPSGRFRGALFNRYRRRLHVRTEILWVPTMSQTSPAN